jgi:murein DD-endopeptidase MepM/ murein hydrolase activator NlpD
MGLAFLAMGVLAPAPASGLHNTWETAWLQPVAGRVVRPFQAPRTRFGRGHLGVDFAAAPGTPVHAVGAGTVEFAGVVARVRHVVVRHAGGLRTSYSYLESIRVRRGQTVRRGAVLGTSGGRGENHEPGVFHLGLRRGATFVDPMQLFAPPDLSETVHLAPDELERRPLDWPRFRTDSGGTFQLFARP